MALKIRQLMNKIIIILAASMIGLLLLVLAFAIPTSLMEWHSNQDAELLAQEGLSPTSFGPYVSSRNDDGQIDIKRIFTNNWITLRDNFTDAIMLDMAVYDGGEGCLDQALNIYRKQSFFKATCTGEYDGQNDTGEIETYSRYWHGYLVILKPLLVFFSYSTIRIVNLIVLILLYVLLCRNMLKRVSARYMLVFLFATLFVAPYMVPFCIQFTTTFFTTLIALIVLFRYYEVLKTRNLLGYYFLIVGMVVCYFDLLTYPLISVGFPVIFLIALDQENEIGISQVFQFGLNWFCGWAGMWAMKWIICTALTGQNIIMDAYQQAMFRTSKNKSFLFIIGEHFYKYCNWVYLLLILIAVVIMIIGIVKNKNKMICIRHLSLYVLIAVLPFLWWFVLRNHSVHPFTGKIISVTVFAGMTLLYELTGSKIVKNDGRYI